MPHERLPTALSIYADLVRRPHLPRDQFEEGRQVCLQELRAAEDDLAHRAMQELRRCIYPAPWGRASQGTHAGVQAIKADAVARHVAEYYQPRGAILAVAGRFDWDTLSRDVAALFEDWPEQTRSDVLRGARGPRAQHIPHMASQTQIAVAFPSVPYAHPDYYQARGAVGILSDGMSSRLFTEVRENRGLAYTVYATCHSLRDEGSVMCYAGTSGDLAQETLDVLLHELRRIGDGIEPEELRRLKARIKSGLIMQQESSSSRAGSLAADWYHFGRPRSLDEVGGQIDALSCESINAYLDAHRPQQFTIVTLGSVPLEIPDGVS